MSLCHNIKSYFTVWQNSWFYVIFILVHQCSFTSAPNMHCSKYHLTAIYFSASQPLKENPIIFHIFVTLLFFIVLRYMYLLAHNMGLTSTNKWPKIQRLIDFRGWWRVTVFFLMFLNNTFKGQQRVMFVYWGSR